MPTTLVHLIKYPAGTVAPNVPIVMQDQAQSVEAALVNITKRRYAEFQGPTIDSNPGAGNSTGLLAAVPAKTWNNDFCAPFASGSFGLNMLKSGVYSVHGLCNYQQSPGNVNVSMYVTGTGAPGIVDSHSQGTYGDWQTGAAVPGIYLEAGWHVEFIQANSGGVFFDFKVKIAQLSD